MTTPHHDLLQQVAENHALVQRLENELGLAKRQQRDLHLQALEAVCPFATFR